MQQRVPGTSLSQSEFLLEEQETNQATDILIWVRESLFGGMLHLQGWPVRGC